MGKIKVAVTGVGNSCSALILGVQDYSTPRCERGLDILDVEIGGYRVSRNRDRRIPRTFTPWREDYA